MGRNKEEGEEIDEEHEEAVEVGNEEENCELVERGKTFVWISDRAVATSWICSGVGGRLMVFGSDTVAQSSACCPD